MLDFEKELEILLAQESKPLPQSELEGLVTEGRELIQSFNKKQADIALQIEEVYDMVKDVDSAALQEALRDEKARAGQLALAAVGLCDLIDDFYEFANGSGSEGLVSQAELMRKNADGLIESCAMQRFGEAGQLLDPKIHSVRAGAVSPFPRDHIARVLNSGYYYLGAVIRKAAVVVSNGTEDSR